MGSKETAITIPGGPRVIDVFDGNEAPSSPNCTLFSGVDRLLEGSRGALGYCIDGVCGLGDYPQPDLPRETSRSRSAPEKSVQFGPDGASFPSKTSITQGPPGIVIAVSSDPILPQR